MKEMILKFHPEFQKEIFQKVINKYGGSINAEKYLNIPASSIRGYKNLYFNYVPKAVMDRIVKLDIIKLKEIQERVILSVDKLKLINNNLDAGRVKRKNILARLKKDIPCVKEIITDNKIDVYKWFKQYKKLLDSGFRKTNHKTKGKNILVEYSNYDKTSMRLFQVTLPKEIIMDDEFSYFFGLWCGDRAGGKRFGVCNQNKEILEFAESFLRKHGQTVQKILYISPSIKIPKISYDKMYYTKDDIKGWCLSIHSQNGILSSFFHYLQKNLKELLNSIKTDSFFAGLFDAEGNVSLYNKSFRWACQNKELVAIYKKTLDREGLKNRYDGSSIVCYDKESFLRKIYPNLKHPEKINKTMLLCNIGGDLLEEHKEVLRYVENFPNSTQKQIAKALKANKVYSRLRILKDFDLVSKKGYPHRYVISKKGKNHQEKKKL